MQPPMASLTVRTQNFQAEGPASSRRQGPYHYHSRLPTPGTSTRPFGAFDGPQADDGSRDVYFRHDVERRDSYHRESQPKDSHHNLLPSSPPYQLSDSQRPLLPPLMTVSVVVRRLAQLLTFSGTRRCHQEPASDTTDEERLFTTTSV